MLLIFISLTLLIQRTQTTDQISIGHLCAAKIDCQTADKICHAESQPKCVATNTFAYCIWNEKIFIFGGRHFLRSKPLISIYLTKNELCDMQKLMQKGSGRFWSDKFTHYTYSNTPLQCCLIDKLRRCIINVNCFDFRDFLGDFC